MRLCQGLACYSPSDSWALGVRESETWWCDGVGFTVHHAVGEAKVKYVERRHDILLSLGSSIRKTSHMSHSSALKNVQKKKTQIRNKKGRSEIVRAFAMHALEQIQLLHPTMIKKTFQKAIGSGTN
jgi:hypothetical protein